MITIKKNTTGQRDDYANGCLPDLTVSKIILR